MTEEFRLSTAFKHASLTLDSLASEHRWALRGALDIPAPHPAKCYAAAARSGYFLLFLTFGDPPPHPHTKPGHRLLPSLRQDRWMGTAERLRIRAGVRMGRWAGAERMQCPSLWGSGYRKMRLHT